MGMRRVPLLFESSRGFTEPELVMVEDVDRHQSSPSGFTGSGSERFEDMPKYLINGQVERLGLQLPTVLSILL